MGNLLNIPVIGGILRSTWTWRVLRLAMFCLLLLMIAYGWHQHAIPGVSVKDPLMYTNFTTLNLWVVWMMGMVGVALVLGRSWCTVCPVGWLNGVVSRFGWRRELPDWLNNFVPVTLVLVSLQLFVYFFAIHRYPDYSAVLLLWMIVLALLAGLVWQRRAFCLLLCPAGAVFSLYARLAPWQLRVKSCDVCASCHDKPCVATGTSWKQASLGNLNVSWRSRSEGCPVDLTLAEIKDSSACTLCMNCVHTCCNDNIKLGFRSWPGDLRRGILAPGEAFFFLVLLGLLTANFSKVYVDLREAVFWLPETLALSLGWDAAGFYPLAVIWIGLLFPLLLLIPGVLVYLVGQVKVQSYGEKPQAEKATEQESVFSLRALMLLVGRFALAVLPLVLSAHLALAVVKLNAKLGYLPLALQDVTGVKSFLAINTMRTLPPPGVIVSLDIVKWVVVAILVCGALFAALAAKAVAGRQEPGGKIDTAFMAASLLTILILCGFYGATVIEWLFVR